MTHFVVAFVLAVVVTAAIAALTFRPFMRWVEPPRRRRWFFAGAAVFCGAAGVAGALDGRWFGPVDIAGALMFASFAVVDHRRTRRES